MSGEIPPKLGIANLRFLLTTNQLTGRYHRSWATSLSLESLRGLEPVERMRAKQFVGRVEYG